MQQGRNWHLDTIEFAVLWFGNYTVKTNKIYFKSTVEIYFYEWNKTPENYKNFGKRTKM